VLTEETGVEVWPSVSLTRDEPRTKLACLHTGARKMADLKMADQKKRPLCEKVHGTSFDPG